VIASTIRTIDAPGSKVVYDVWPSPSTEKRPLMLIGQPMGASGFVTLREHFLDRTLITYDPRGAERSHKEDPTIPT